MSEEIDPVVRDHDDRAMLERPDLWPLYPFLPLKRTAGGDKWDSGEGSTRHYEFAVWSAPRLDVHRMGSPVVVTLGGFHSEYAAAVKEGSVSGLPKKEYDDLDALIADGWIVDG